MAADKSSLEKQLEDYRFALSKVSHEVRNPVTLINSYLQLLEKDYPELKQNALWSDITEEMLFLRRLLDDLSCYNNTFRCQFSATEMSPFLLKLSESVYLLFPDSPISYQISVPENLPTLSVDPLKLNQHPFHAWQRQQISDNPRYVKTVEHFGYLAQQATVFGQHVHVGCQSGDDAIYLLHGLSRFVPHFIALNAASPWFDSTDREENRYLRF